MPCRETRLIVEAGLLSEMPAPLRHAGAIQLLDPGTITVRSQTKTRHSAILHMREVLDILPI